MKNGFLSSSEMLSLVINSLQCKESPKINFTNSAEIVTVFPKFHNNEITVGFTYLINLFFNY